MKSARVIAATVAIALSTPAALAEPLKPTSKWNVDYDVAQCTASRNYGTEAKPLLLILKPSPFGGVMRVLVAAPGGFASPAVEEDASVQFAGQERVRTKAVKFSSGDRKMTIRAMNLPLQAVRAAQAAPAVEITNIGTDRTFALDNVAPVLTELEKCRVDLLQMYNADRAQVRQAAKPDKSLHGLFSYKDYPAAALRQRSEGTVSIAVMVDETGKVADCSVDETAGAATLDSMSCYIIQQRAVFKPATDAYGKPIRSIYTQRITWRIAGSSR